MTFGDTIKNIILEQIFNSLKDPDGTFPWRVLLLDELTTKILSSILKMSELQSKGISHVENLMLNRENLPLDAIYFISPTEKSVKQLCRDFQGKSLKYKSSRVFFSSSPNANLLSLIKQSKLLISNLKSLKEINMEVSIIDSHCFQTLQSNGLITYFKDDAKLESNEYRNSNNLLIKRLASVFLSIHEKPIIRYKNNSDNQSGSYSFNISKVIAENLYEYLNQNQNISSSNVTNCHCLILDRGYDPVAPFIHEWTYEAMVHDLLDINVDVLNYKTSDNIEKKLILNEQDDLWKELRHMHIAEATEMVNMKIDDFRKKNAVARIKENGNEKLSTSDMRHLIQSLPEYRGFLSRLSCHIDITQCLFKITDERKLKDLGELEQDLIFGDKHSKDLIQWLQVNQNLKTEDKMRLFMCYLATHPEKLDSERRLQWQKIAQLKAEEMNTVLNLECLGVSILKKNGQSILNFVRKNKSNALRKDRLSGSEENQYALSRFQPELLDIIEKMCSDDLPENKYPYVNTPSNEKNTSNSTSVMSVRKNVKWTRNNIKDNKDSAINQKSTIVIFIIGGITRSEMRVVHKLSSTLSKDIILGGTSVETPNSYINQLTKLNVLDDDFSNVQ